VDRELTYVDLELTYVDRELTYVDLELTYVDLELTYVDRELTYVDPTTTHIAKCRLTQVKMNIFPHFTISEPLTCTLNILSQLIRSASFRKLQSK
jgi:hypothetical protein